MAEPLTFTAPLTLPAQLEARAEHPVAASRIVLMHDDRQWTYRQYRNESVRMAHFLLARLGRIDDKRPGHVAMLLENHLELLSLFAGCGYAGLTLFGINTGLRGEVLVGLLEQSRSRLLVVEDKLWPEVERVSAGLRHIEPQNILVLPTSGALDVPGERNLLTRLDDEAGSSDTSLAAPDVDVQPDTGLMVIYTSGTTGLPKGINNNHMKLLATGIGVSGNLGLGQDDVGYTCMPLFHSNSMFVGFMPAFWVGGSVGVRERFTASGFVPDVFDYGATYWNYVGEPVHYVLGAIEREHGGDREKIAAAVTQNPRNQLRYAVGNGAAAPDIDLFTEYLGLDDMFELYGSTEAAISTFRRKGDPRSTVGVITDERVVILDPEGQECPPAELDDHGTLLNYEDCVGEICRVSDETGLFQGYFDNDEANREKFRDGVYHSGDLGHVLLQDGKRYLYFDGRTDDWIRKDGENFSASQVGRLLSEHPDVQLAVAYGVPCAVSDEHVMTAMLMREGAHFDPAGFLAWCEEQLAHGSMDRKWIPDFVRVVDDFEYTQTQKVLVRNLKKIHFDLNRLPQSRVPIYFRVRGDKAFREFTRDEYERVRGEFEAAERVSLLDR